MVPLPTDDTDAAGAEKAESDASSNVDVDAGGDWHVQNAGDTARRSVACMLYGNGPT
jgi:hypothetical protein